MTPSWCFRPLPVSKRDIPAGNGGNRTGRPSDICRTASLSFRAECLGGVFVWCVGGVFGVCSCGAEAPFLRASFAAGHCSPGASFAAGRLSERPHRSGAGNGAVRGGRKSSGTAVSGNGRSGKRSLRGGLGASRFSDKAGSRGERASGRADLRWDGVGRKGLSGGTDSRMGENRTDLGREGARMKRDPG